MSTFKPIVPRGTQPLVVSQPVPTKAVARHIPQSSWQPGKALTWALFILLSNVGNLLYHNPGLIDWSEPAPDIPTEYIATNMGARRVAMKPAADAAHREAPLYLLDKASLFVRNPNAFAEKVKEISAMLGIAPEWLMAVIYSESKFDAGVENHRGSGATGLIQFMPLTASEMNVSLERLKRMNHLQQLEYVYLYLQTVRERYGDYQSLTDLYLAVLYPKARGEEYCYTLYARPSQHYKQNIGLDENKDGRVTISDVDRRLKRLYPTAYIAEPAMM